ncbi:MAG: hypothetical protein ACRYFU_08395 [Janthinobacterium lividum]
MAFTLMNMGLRFVASCTEAMQFAKPEQQVSTATGMPSLIRQERSKIGGRIYGGEGKRIRHQARPYVKHQVPLRLVRAEDGATQNSARKRLPGHKSMSQTERKNGSRSVSNDRRGLRGYHHRRSFFLPTSTGKCGRGGKSGEDKSPTTRKAHE